MGRPQHQHDHAGGKAGRVTRPAERLPQGGATGRPQRPGIDLVAQAGVALDDGVGDAEGPQLPGRGGRGGQGEQLPEQPPLVGQVVVGPLLDTGGVPVGQPGQDGQQGDDQHRRVDGGQQDDDQRHLDGRLDQAEDLARRPRQGAALGAEVVDLGQVLGPLEVLEERAPRSPAPRSAPPGTGWCGP